VFGPGTTLVPQVAIGDGLARVRSPLFARNRATQVSLTRIRYGLAGRTVTACFGATEIALIGILDGFTRYSVMACHRAAMVPGIRVRDGFAGRGVARARCQARQQDDRKSEVSFTIQHGFPFQPEDLGR
jgi:hypothetical protein